MRALWDAANNRWDQWVLNYTQSRQFNLLRHLGFDSPNWEDLSYVLLGLIVLASLGGAAWTLWERRQHDPWLRQLERARTRLRAVGVDLAPGASPRQMADAVRGLGSAGGGSGDGIVDWLLRLEAQRYARDPRITLATLVREFKQLHWPR